MFSDMVDILVGLYFQVSETICFLFFFSFFHLILIKMQSSCNVNIFALKECWLMRWTHLSWQLRFFKSFLLSTFFLLLEVAERGQACTNSLCWNIVQFNCFQRLYGNIWLPINPYNHRKRLDQTDQETNWFPWNNKYHTTFDREKIPRVLPI